MEIKFTEGLIKYLESNPHIRKPIWKLALNLSTLYTVVCLIRMKYDFNRKRHIDSRYIGGMLFKKFVKNILYFKPMITREECKTLIDACYNDTLKIVGDIDPFKKELIKGFIGLAVQTAAGYMKIDK